MTECQRRYAQVEEGFSDNNGMGVPEYPDCETNGNFAPRQCRQFDNVCWCVDPETGTKIAGTVTEPDSMGYNSLDCDSKFACWFTVCWN